MKGVVLAGGRGTRLRPVTRVVNKHMLPIYDEPMIYYPVSTLIDAGIDDILIISNAEHIGKYIELLEEDYEADFQYKVQSEPLGIAHAVGLAEDFVDDEFAVILGDNILVGELQESVQSFNGEGAKIYLTQVEEPAAYGVASVEEGRVTDLQEKPDVPESNYAVIGLYLYTSDVFDVIRDLEPSDRGEYEITDVNRHYLNKGTLTYDLFDGEWYDAGTPEGVFQASKRVRKFRGQK
ncbi:sugar nucleotidyltransferase [Halobellus rubicundus]|uniref:glucose-1-phosphate thymidylyltransferase n=1 Tax=Halobellus rubicundus TaxID=2996466 RepID=A0ABD5MH17_9EURY